MPTYKHYGERIIVQEIVEEKIGSIIVPTTAGKDTTTRRGVVLSAEPGYNYSMTAMTEVPEKSLVGKKIAYSTFGSIELEKGIFSVKEENVLAIIEE
jgi:co-chaperonin GroES (HSP10)